MYLQMLVVEKYLYLMDFIDELLLLFLMIKNIKEEDINNKLNKINLFRIYLLIK
jgi:hypothetical protein